MWEILSFELFFFVIENSTKLQKLVLKGEQIVGEQIHSWAKLHKPHYGLESL
jgi:hypothetical protein